MSPYLLAMALAFALLVIGVPILDIVSLIKVAALLGFWPTLAVVIGGAAVGTLLVRHQGLAIGRAVRQSLNAGRLPVKEAFDGACLLVAGALFLLPGVLSDALALLLLLPPVRALLRKAIAWRTGTAGATVAWTTTRPPPGFPAGRGPILEGEYERWETPATEEKAGATRLPPPAAPDPAPRDR